MSRSSITWQHHAVQQLYTFSYKLACSVIHAISFISVENIQAVCGHEGHHLEVHFVTWASVC